MAYKDGDWNDRLAGGLGDLAEAKFEEVYKQGFVRAGLNRPPIRVSDLSLRERYRPDYLTGKGYVECQGFGKDQKFKLKWEKLNCLLFWQQLEPVRLFVFDSFNDRWALIPLKQLCTWIDGGRAQLKFFRERKAYFELPADLLFSDYEVD